MGCGAPAAVKQLRADLEDADAQLRGTEALLQSTEEDAFHKAQLANQESAESLRRLAMRLEAVEEEAEDARRKGRAEVQRVHEEERRVALRCKRRLAEESARAADAEARLRRLNVELDAARAPQALTEGEETALPGVSLHDAEVQAGQERSEQECLEQERLRRDRLQQELLQQEREAGQERLEQEFLEQERLRQDRLQQELLQREREASLQRLEEQQEDLRGMELEECRLQQHISTLQAEWRHEATLAEREAARALAMRSERDAAAEAARRQFVEFDELMLQQVELAAAEKAVPALRRRLGEALEWQLAAEDRLSELEEHAQASTRPLQRELSEVVRVRDEALSEHRNALCERDQAIREREAAEESRDATCAEANRKVARTLKTWEEAKLQLIDERGYAAELREALATCARSGAARAAAAARECLAADPGLRRLL